MTKDEAVLAAAALLTGRVEADLIDDLAAEAVQLILDYCHIPDFPEALIPVAVSYTHLDVYKRQLLDEPAPAPDDAIAALRYAVDEVRRGPNFTF